MRFATRVMLAVVCCLPLNPKSGLCQVVLSEVMFDAVGSDAHDEFVEIFNLSQTNTVDLAGWQLTDGVAFDQILAVAENALLGPRQFAIVLDASYFENSNTYDALIPETSLILTIDNQTFGSGGLLNSRPETVSLIDAAGSTVASYTYSVGNQAGFSDEKIDLAGSDEADNWSDSRSVLGTPGAPNSVSPLNFDLALQPGDLSLTPSVIRPGSSISASAQIRNLGTQSVNNFSVVFFEDMNGDSVANADEALAPPLEFSGDLVSGDSTTFDLVLTNLRSGRHQVSAHVDFDLDEDLGNNLSVAEVSVGFQPNSVILNEIMYSPLSEQAEWVEIYNASPAVIDLSSWLISDSDTTARVLIGGPPVLNPDGFVVLAQDSSLLQIFSPPPNSLIVMRDWPSLNNSNDNVVLYDLAGFVVDRVDYQSTWGGDQGRSLERINPELTSNDSTNWSSSVAFEGGTPGQQNSIFTRVLPTATLLTIEPNPFSPDGDGHEDFAVISYEIPVSTAVVNLKIYDIRGRLVRFLANNTATGARNAFVWDGKDQDARRARLGIYIVFLQALNAQAGIIQSEKRTVVLAGTL